MFNITRFTNIIVIFQTVYLHTVGAECTVLLGLAYSCSYIHLTYN